jgi:hypothetical protein
MAVVGGALVACSGGGSKGSDPGTASPHKKSNVGSNGDTSSSDTPSPPDSTPPPPPPPPASDGGTDAPHTPPPGGAVCKPIAGCASTVALKDVPGDGAGGETTATLAGSQWYTIRVQKTLFGSTPLSVDVLLTPPAGGKYELHVYQSDCMTEVAAPVVQADGTIDVYSWWNGKGEDLAIEVRYVSGACDAAQKWTLDVIGGL